MRRLSPEYAQYLKELKKVEQEYPYPMYTREFRERKLEERGIHRPQELVDINRQIAEENAEIEAEELEEGKSIDDMSSEELGKVVSRRAIYDAGIEAEGGEEMGIGDRVVDGDGIEGRIVDVNGELARVEWDNGDKSEMHMNRLHKASGWQSD